MTAPRAHATWHHARPAPPRARACPALPAARVPQPFQPHDQPPSYRPRAAGPHPLQPIVPGQRHERPPGFL